MLDIFIRIEFFSLICNLKTLKKSSWKSTLGKDPVHLPAISLNIEATKEKIFR